MSVVRSVNRYISSVIDTLRQFTLWRVWLLLSLNFGLQWLMLLALDNFTWGPLYEPVMGFVGLLGDQYKTGFSHYPGHFLILPYVFDWARFILGVVIEGLILGAVALTMYENHFEDSTDEDKTPLRVVFSSWIHLSVAWMLMNGSMLLVSLVLPGLFESWMAGSPRRILLYQFGFIPVVYMVILALFYFVIPRIAVFGENIFQAIKGAFLISIRNPISCLALAALILIGPVIISFFTGQPSLVVEKFKPELVYWALVAGLFMDMIVNFLWMGTASRFLVEIEE